MRDPNTQVTQTKRNYTGQKLDGTGLLFYNARYYDPGLGRFVSPDSIVPGASSGAGGAGGTVGAEQNSKLTVDFHETGFLNSTNAEIAVIVRKGFWFQLSDKDRQEVSDPWGPINPQALNRYAYVLNNPLSYIDPNGHRTIRVYTEFLASFIGQFQARTQEQINGTYAWYLLLAAGATVGSVACGPLVWLCGAAAGGATAAAIIGYNDAQTEASQINATLATVQDYANKAGAGSYVEFQQDKPGSPVTATVYDAKGKVVYKTTISATGIDSLCQLCSDLTWSLLHDAAERTRRMLKPADQHNVSERQN